MKKFDKELFKNVTLLYVEDDPMTLEEVSFFLERYVKKLIIAKNGEEGLELFIKHNPDMVITDIQMPIKNGLKMAEEIFKINPSVPIAVTSAYSDGSYLMNAIELGIDKYIIKPINMMEILAVIQKSLQLSLPKNSFENDHSDYIQFILDSNPTFMFIMHCNKVEFANKKLLDLLGHDTIISFNEQIENFNNLVELLNVNTNKNWIDYLLENKEEKHLVKLKNKEAYLKKEFYVSYKYFENMNKSVFIFVDTNEEKLKRINYLTNNLINDIKENIPTERIEMKLEEILQLTRY
jgi:YesN/AraC family two-component response regulator